MSSEALDQNQADEQIEAGIEEEIVRTKSVGGQRDVHNSETLAFIVLDLAAGQKYEKAIQEVRAYLDYKSNYPNYRAQTEGLFVHIANIIAAIKTKKALSSANLPVSKRKEVIQAVNYHFNDLKLSLKKITQVERNLQMRDSRSTMWVVKAWAYAFIAVVLFKMLQEGAGSMLESVIVMADDFSRWFYQFSGL